MAWVVPVRPLKSTVPVFAMKSPFVWVQLPATERVPDVEVNAPPERLKLLESVIAPEPPENVPED